MTDEKMRKGPKPKNPQLVKVPVGYKLPRWIIAWMAAQDKSRAKLIEEALIAHYRISMPGF